MEYMASNLKAQKQLISSKNILIIQDIDGVCIPLVKDPMTRELESKYIYAVKRFAEEFFVLTCGEHEGPRGVNRIIERSLGSTTEPKNKELYLRGLAACGVEYQDNDGEISIEGVSEKELKFLSKVPRLIRPKFNFIVKNIFPELSQEDINFHAVKSICETRFSPTININSLFDLVNKDSDKRKLIQISFEKMMNEIILKAESEGLKNSFFLHISPNLGNKNGKEIIKLSSKDDIGSTDIQLLIKGAVKDSGVLFLLNKFISNKTGKAPFGSNFNFRNSPNSIKEKIDLCKRTIQIEDMPLIVGVGIGSAITSTTDGGQGNIASQQQLDMAVPDPEFCRQWGASAFVIDVEMYTTLNPSTSFVTQPALQPGCVIRRENWTVLQKQGAISNEDVRECKQRMNTFAYIGSIRDKPIVKCVYQTDVNENKFIIKGDGQAEDGGVGINKEAIQF